MRAQVKGCFVEHVTSKEVKGVAVLVHDLQDELLLAIWGYLNSCCISIVRGHNLNSHESMFKIDYG